MKSSRDHRAPHENRDRRDDLLARGQRLIVVIRAFDNQKAFWFMRGLEQAVTLRGRNDGVVGACDDEYWTRDLRDAIDRRISIPQQPGDRQEWIVHAPHVHERREGRTQDERAGWVLDAQPDSRTPDPRDTCDTSRRASTSWRERSVRAARASSARPSSDGEPGFSA